MSGWIYLTLAGFFEIGFTTFMKLSNGSYKNPWFYAFISCIILSFYFLQNSLKDIPLGTAYAIWTGIGAVGTVIVGMIFFKEPSSLFRVLLLANIIASIVGLKLLA